MKRKMTILLFGLLLAVGWTSDASAQKLQQGKPWYQSAFFQRMTKPTMTDDSKARPFELSDNQTAIEEGTNGKRNAPRRANYNSTAKVTHIKSWYDAKHYTWYDADDNEQTASYTDPVTDAHQMFWFTRSLYTDKTMPGIKFSIAQTDGDGNNGFDLAYEGCDFGYWVSGDVTQDIRINMNSYCYITAIWVYDYAGNEITSYDANSSTLPTGWSMPNESSMTRNSEYVYTSNGYQNWYYWRLSSTSSTSYTRAFVISKDLLTGKGGVYVEILARQNYSSSETRDHTCYVSRYDYNKGKYYSVAEHFNMSNEWDYYTAQVNGPVTPPDENGYSVVLVKLNDDYSGRTETYTYTDSALYSFYDKYVDELQLLTDGLRVNENSEDAGTLFSYTGDVNRFFFISKGKLYPISGSENSWTTNSSTGDYERHADRAPFYNMYEEFSPYVESGTEDHSDFYEKLKQGTTYPILHDCQSVCRMIHYFAMSGSEGTTENRVNSLVLYIPDNRGAYSSRTYDVNHQPTVGMYMIDLYADIEPSDTQDDYYTVTVNWYDNLDVITHSEGIPQTYTLYEIRDKDGDGIMDTTQVYQGPLTTWSFDYPVGDPTAYNIDYYVIGTPTAATNQDTFFAKSNTDEVTVPGKTDFIGLQWWRYESDYVTDDGTNQEVNYYRNFLAPHALSSSNQAGISAGNVGTNVRTLTLYRDDTPVIDLELVMNGNKAYYRIKYRPNTQKIEPGYNENGELNTNN